MKRLLFFLPVLFFLKVSAQEPYYGFKKFREKNLLNEQIKKYPEKTPPLSKSMGKVIWSDTNGTFILQLDKSVSIDSLQLLQRNQATAKLLFTQPNGTRIYVLPQDNMPCLVPDISQFNMPVVGKGMKITGMPPGLAPPNSIIPEK